MRNGTPRAKAANTGKRLPEPISAEPPRTAAKIAAPLPMETTSAWMPRLRKSPAFSA